MKNRYKHHQKHHRHEYCDTDIGLYFTQFILNNFKTQGIIMSTSFSKLQFVIGIVVPFDVNGNPAPVQPGSVTYVSSDTSVCTATVDPKDQLSVKVAGVADGTATVTVTANDTNGNPVTPAVVTITIADVVAVHPAVGLGITFGDAQPQ